MRSGARPYTPLVALVAALFVGSFARAAQATTVVSLTFDDALADQTQADQILSNAGMKGTFYIITGRLGQSGYLTAQQVQAIAAHGHEIGGHTTYHLNLPTLDADEQKREMCVDRNNLLNLGLQPTTLAYPFGAENTASEVAAAYCGYNAARGVGNLVASSCTSCPAAETIPPRNAYHLSTPDSVGSTTTLQDMKNMVTNAEQNGGGWVPMVFHHVCSGCNPQSVSASDLQSFVTWLGARASSGTIVKTVAEVIGGPVQPAVAPPPPPPPPAGTSNVLRNPSLESDANADGTPDCWMHAGYGTNTVAWSVVAGRTGGSAQRVDLSNVQSGDVKLLTLEDLGACAPPASPGQLFTASAWYTSTAPARFVVYTRATNGVWSFWTQSAWFPAQSGWTQLTWSLPAVPSGAVAVAVGLSIASNGALTIDDFSLVSPSVNDTTPPVISFTQPASGSTVSGIVNLTATATDDVGVVDVDFLVNGAVVASASASGSNSFNASWNSATVPDGSVTLTARASDGAGNASSTTTQLNVANGPNANLLANASLELDSDGDGSPDCWLQTGYGTNSATWLRISSAHSGSWAQQVTIDSISSGDLKLVSAQNAACAPPATAGAQYDASAWYLSDVPARFVVYYLDATGTWQWWAQSPEYDPVSSWTQVTWTTPPVPSGATAISMGMSIQTVGQLALDDLSLVSRTVADTTPPTVALTAPSSGSTVAGTVTLTASAGDAGGIARLDFLVDGAVVGSATGDGRSVAWNSTTHPNGGATLAVRATDLAGNSSTSADVQVNVSNTVPSANLLKNASLETDSSGKGTPDCWKRSGFGTNTANWTRTSDAHSGAWAQQVEITSITNGDRKFVSLQDGGTCAPAGTVGRSYSVSAWYHASAPVRLTVYYRDTSGNWQWWAQSGLFPASTGWSLASFKTPALPAGATNVSVALGLPSVGSMTVDDFDLE